MLSVLTSKALSFIGKNQKFRRIDRIGQSIPIGPKCQFQSLPRTFVRYISYYTNLVDMLTQDQISTIDFQSKYMLVLSGTGTGKSICAAARVVHLLNNGVAPDRILLLTHSETTSRKLQKLIDLNTKMDSLGTTVKSLQNFASNLASEHGSPVKFTPDEEFEKLLSSSKECQDALLNTTSLKHNYYWGQLIAYFSKLGMFGITVDHYKSFIQKLDNELQEYKEDAVVAQLQKNHQEFMLSYREETLSHHRHLCKIYDAYMKFKNESNTHLFSDRMNQAIELVAQPRVKNRLIERFQHVIIDELESWGRSDWRFLQEMVFFNGSHELDRTVLMFGDENTSIMPWTHPPSDIHQWIAKETNENCSFVTLRSNFRSKPQVLEAAQNVLIDKNPRPDYFLSTYMRTAPNIDNCSNLKQKDDHRDGFLHFQRFQNETEEIQGLAEKVQSIFKQAMQQSGSKSQSPNLSPSILPTISILVRYKSEVTTLTQELNRYGISTSISLDTHPEVKFLLNVLSSIFEPSDMTPLYHLLCSGKFAIDGKFLAKITEIQSESKLPLRTVLREYIKAEKNRIKSASTQSNFSNGPKGMVKIEDDDILSLFANVEKLLKLLDIIESQLTKETLQQLTYRILKEMDLLEAMSHPRNSVEASQSENLAKLFNAMEQIESKFSNRRTNPALLWNQLKTQCSNTTSNIYQNDHGVDESPPGVVSIRTIWSSKPFEYDYVMIPFCTDSNYPGSTKIKDLQESLHHITGQPPPNTNDVLFEMRKVFYTALTRAKLGVFCSYHSQKPMLKTLNRPSRFLSRAFGVSKSDQLRDGFYNNRSKGASSMDDFVLDHSISLAQKEKKSTDQIQSADDSRVSTKTQTSSGQPQSSPTPSKENIFGGKSFHFSASEMPIVTLDQLRVYLRCPLQFYQQFHLGMNPPSPKLLPIFQKAILSVINAIATEEVDHLALSSLNKLRNIFEQTFLKNGLDPFHNPRIYEHGISLTESLLEGGEYLDMKLEKTNVEFAIPISESPSITLQGSIPRIYNNGHVRYFVQYDESHHPSDEIIQSIAKFLGFAYLNLYKAPAKSISIEFINSKYEMKILKYNPELSSIKQTVGQIKSIADQVASLKFTGTDDIKLCSVCPFQSSCPGSLVKNKKK